MNILMVADVPPDPNAGAAGTEYQTMLALRELGHDVDCIWEGDLRPRRIQHGNLHYLLELPWAYRDTIRERVAKKQYDVIHVNQPYAWRAAMDHVRQKRGGVFVARSQGWEPRIADALRPWRRRYGFPAWQFPRGLFGVPMSWVLNRIYPRWCAKACDGIIVSCSEDRDYIISFYGMGPERVCNIPMAPTKEFCVDSASGMTETRIRKILYAGQAAFFKAPMVLAEVFSQLAESHTDLTFTWCCPEANHNVCRGMLRAEARARTTFIGWMPQADLVRLYDSHGIFVFPSFTEGFGKVFIEAMSRGLCVVASDTAGPHDLIRHHDNGCLVKVGDVDAFCRDVERLLKHPSLAESMSRAASPSAREFTWTRVACETVSFYESLLRRKRGAFL